MCFFNSDPEPVVVVEQAPTEDNKDAEDERSEAARKRLRAVAAGGRQDTITNVGGAKGLTEEPQSIYKNKLGN